MINVEWIAGFFEGEGTICLFPHRNKLSPSGFYWSLSIGISQGEDGKDALDYTGDSLTTQGISSSVDLSRKEESENRQSRYNLNIRGVENCIKFLNLVQPYLVMEKRKKQVELAQEALNIMFDKEHLIKRGFIHLIEIMIEMQKWKSRSSQSKYTMEFFEELWKKQGGFWSRPRHRGRITKRQWPIIIDMRKEGKTLREIGEQFGVKPQSIYYLLSVKKIGESSDLT